LVHQNEPLDEAMRIGVCSRCRSIDINMIPSSTQSGFSKVPMQPK
jgi:hypothetical protein